MNAMQGTIRNGQIVTDQPVSWPDGCRVKIEPLPEEEKIGLGENEWPTTPEAIAEWLRWFDSVEPVQLTPEEEADWKAWRQKVKEYTKQTPTTAPNETVEDRFRKMTTLKVIDDKPAADFWKKHDAGKHKGTYEP